ncbi:MAG TPA: hypothetical protein VFP49_12730 [Nitrososphaeraceae archaeon]|nr:hypothetical protein [Nitrososphaeraceae archaeon]
MTVVVDVKETQRIQQKKRTNKNKVNPIPDYPVDDKGNKLARFPVHTLSNDEKFDIDMDWSPKVLQTDETSTLSLISRCHQMKSSIFCLLILKFHRTIKHWKRLQE